VTAGRKSERFFYVFSRRDLVFELFKNWSTQNKSHTRHVRDKLGENRLSDGREKFSGEKKITQINRKNVILPKC